MVQMETQTSLTSCKEIHYDDQHLLIIWQNHILKTLIHLIKENDFTFKIRRSRQYPVEIMSVTDYADDLVFLSNTHVQAGSQLQAARDTNLYMKG